VEHTLRQRLRNLRSSFLAGRCGPHSRVSGLANMMRDAAFDVTRRSRPIRRDFDSLGEADLCAHEDTVAIRTLPRRIVRCRRCGVAFATTRDPLERAIEVHDGAYFLANKDFVYPDGKPDVFSYVMPVTLFFHSLGFPKFRPANRRVLDVGCGVGIMPRYLEFLGMEAYGVEISPWAAQYARDELGQSRIVTGTVQEAAFPDGHFSLVTMRHVLEHLDDPLPVLREIQRILEPGGRLYVEVPCSERDTTDYLIGDHFWFYSESSLRYLLGCLGFRDVRANEATFIRELHNVPFLFAAAMRP
jgi:SAM-dependent methyltransferase